MNANDEVFANFIKTNFILGKENLEILLSYLYDRNENHFGESLTLLKNSNISYEPVATRGERMEIRKFIQDYREKEREKQRLILLKKKLLEEKIREENERAKKEQEEKKIKKNWKKENYY